MISVAVNITSVIIAAIVTFIVGWIWHSPMLFGKQWMKVSGMSAKDMKKMEMVPMVLQLVTAIVTAYVFAFLLGATQSTTIADAAQGAFWIWLGFYATTSMGPVLWEGKSWDLWIFKNAYALVSLIIMGIVLVSF